MGEGTSRRSAKFLYIDLDSLDNKEGRPMLNENQLFEIERRAKGMSVSTGHQPFCNAEDALKMIADIRRLKEFLCTDNRRAEKQKEESTQHAREQVNRIDNLKIEISRLNRHICIQSNTIAEFTNEIEKERAARRVLNEKIEEVTAENNHLKALLDRKDKEIEEMRAHPLYHVTIPPSQCGFKELTHEEIKRIKEEMERSSARLIRVEPHKQDQSFLIEGLVRTQSLLMQEIERLKQGKFTEEEFQNLCHNFSADDVCRFKKGCKEYQIRLFEERSDEVEFEMLTKEIEEVLPHVVWCVIAKEYARRIVAGIMRNRKSRDQRNSAQETRYTSEDEMDMKDK